jgi:hypothetical protein
VERGRAGRSSPASAGQSRRIGRGAHRSATRTAPSGGRCNDAPTLRRLAVHAVEDRFGRIIPGAMPPRSYGGRFRHCWRMRIASDRSRYRLAVSTRPNVSAIRAHHRQAKRRIRSRTGALRLRSSIAWTTFGLSLLQSCPWAAAAMIDRSDRGRADFGRPFCIHIEKRATMPLRRAKVSTMSAHSGASYDAALYDVGGQLNTARGRLAPASRLRLSRRAVTFPGW